MVQLTAGDVLTVAKVEGISLTHRMLSYAIGEGHVVRPSKNSSGQYVFSPENLTEVLDFFSKKKVAANGKASEGVAS